MQSPPHGGVPRYVPGLDGLRGLAVLAVMAMHAELPFAGAGLVGVDVFFVLSGFLITRIVLAELASPDGLSLVSFYARRALRIMPALVLMLAVLGALTLVGATPWTPALFFPHARSAALFLSHVDVFRFGPGGPFPHLWTLGVEADFYVLWPLVLIAASRFARGRVVVLGALTVLAVTTAVGRLFLLTRVWLPRALVVAAVLRWDGLLQGCVLAALVPRLAPLRAVFRVLSPLAVLGLVAVLATNAPLPAVRWGTTAAATATALIVAGLVLDPHGRLATVLEWPPLRWTGLVSYGLYLWHPSVGALVGRRPLPFTLHVAALFALTYATAALSYHLLERPLMRLRVRGATRN